MTTLGNLITLVFMVMLLPTYLLAALYWRLHSGKWVFVTFARYVHFARKDALAIWLGLLLWSGMIVGALSGLYLSRV